MTYLFIGTCGKRATNLFIRFSRESCVLTVVVIHGRLYTEDGDILLIILLYFIVYTMLHIIIIYNIGVPMLYTHLHQPVRESDEQFSLNYPIRQVRENCTAVDIQIIGRHARDMNHGRCMLFLQR